MTRRRFHNAYDNKENFNGNPERLNVSDRADAAVAEVMANIKTHIEKHKGKTQAPFSIAGMQTLVKRTEQIHRLEAALLAWHDFGAGGDESELSDAVEAYFGLKPKFTTEVATDGKPE